MMAEDRCSTLARGDTSPVGGTAVVKVLEQSRPARADEWALRQGMGIAKRHMPGEPFEKYAALATDIAEAIQSAWDHAENMMRAFGPPTEPASLGTAPNPDAPRQNTADPEGSA